jgi:hypothetical protein
MAYYNQNQNNPQNSNLGMNQKKEDEQQQQQAGAAPVQLSNAPSAEAGAPTATAAPTAPVNQPKSPASSGMGGGFSSYAKANQGVASDRLNQAAQRNVQGQGQMAQTGINQANTAFGKRVDQGSLANRYQAIQDVANLTNSARQITAPAAPAPAPQAAAPAGAPPLQATATPAAAPASPVGGLNQNDVNRFKEVINAQYKGPESLRQAGLYEGAADKVNTAQNTLNQTKTASGREEMLRNLFAQRGDYSRGLNKLDAAVLNSSQQGVQNLQNTAAAQGDLQNKLDKAQLQSSAQAQNRTQEISDIRNQARNTFSEGKKAEEAATEQRLSSVVKDWDKLPEHFKEIIRNKTTDNQKVQDEATAKFKADNGYDAISSQYSKAQADLAAAQNRVAHDNYAIPGQGYNTSYEQRQASARALAAAQEKLNAVTGQKQTLDDQISKLTNQNAINFNDQEAGILGLQSGEGLYNLGENAIKTANADKERLVSKDEQARQAALASLAGLDQSNQLDTNLRYSNADKAGTQSALDALDLQGTRKAINEAENNFQDYAKNANIIGEGSKKNKTSGKRYYAQESANLGNLLQNAGYQFGQKNGTPAANPEVLRKLANVSSGQVSGDPNGVSGAMSGMIDPITNMGDGQSLGQNYADLAGTFTGTNLLTGALGLGSVGNFVGGLFGGGSTSAESKADAAGFARQDLQNKVQDALTSSGFQNRANIQNNSVTNTRQSALQQLLANLDKTNT